MNELDPALLAVARARHAIERAFGPHRHRFAEMSDAEFRQRVVVPITDDAMPALLEALIAVLPVDDGRRIMDALFTDASEG